MYCSLTENMVLNILNLVYVKQYLNHELPDVHAGFRKHRGTGDQIANIRWIIEKAKEFQKNIYFCFIDHTKAFDCVDHNKLWKPGYHQSLTVIENCQYLPMSKA